MNDILFEIVKAIFILFLILVTRYTVPYMKQSLENSKYEWIIQWAEIAVRASEQTVFGDKKGAERKAIATKFIKDMLIKKNISISDEQISNIIESAVYAMNKNQ